MDILEKKRNKEESKRIMYLNEYETFNSIHIWFTYSEFPIFANPPTIIL